MKTALITGVSSGIGRAAAQKLLAQGWFVYGSVRRAEDAPPGVAPLVFDVTDRAALARAVEMVDRPLDGLVNNAGIAVPGPLLELAEEDLRRQMEVNFFAPIAVTKAFFPKFNRGARIVMVSSISGLVAFPFLGAYAASKHALNGASESLRRELMLLGFDVVQLCPGAIKTPIWQKYSLAAFAHGAYAAALDKLEAEMKRMAAGGLEVAEIGGLIARILDGPRPATRYVPVPEKLRWALTSRLPARWVDRLIQLTLR
jgi:NAD(P)-dependent dehydrogenase (short-subunit alcohol dehydrogenase family)